MARSFLEKFYTVTEKDILKLEKYYSDSSEILSKNYDEVLDNKIKLELKKAYYSEIISEYSNMLTAKETTKLLSNTLLDSNIVEAMKYGLLTSVKKIETPVFKENERYIVYNYTVDFDCIDKESKEATLVQGVGSIQVDKLNTPNLITYTKLDSLWKILDSIDYPMPE